MKMSTYSWFSPPPRGRACAEGMLFRGTTNLPIKEEKEAVGAAAAADDETAFQFDPVAVEIQRWKYLAPEELQQYYTANGLLN